VGFYNPHLVGKRFNANNIAPGTVGSGLDWGITDGSGTFSPEAVYVLRTDDGANIMVKESGHAPNVLLLFETGSEEYAWMNKIVGYAAGAPNDKGVHLDAWQVRVSNPTLQIRC